MQASSRYQKCTGWVTLQLGGKGSELSESCLSGKRASIWHIRIIFMFQRTEET